MVQATEPHDFPFACECRDGETIPHGLAEGGKMRNHAMKFLRTGEMPPKSGDGLIKHQHRASFFAKLFQLREISRSGRNQIFRFEYDASNLSGMLVERAAADWRDRCS